MEQEFYSAGFITRSHGIKGELKAKFEVTDIQKYAQKASVFLAKKGGKPALFHVELFRIISKDEVLLKLKEIKDRNEADLMRGYEIFFPLAEMPKTSENEFYYHEIQDFSVIDSKLGAIGKVEEVIEMPAQDLIRTTYLGKEVLIPLVHDFILKLDKKKNEIHMNLPEGLVDVYMQPAKETEEEFPE